MGYYKQQEIEQQVEVAHRPKPVTAHVAWPTRRELRQLDEVLKKATRDNERRIVVAKLVTGLAVALTVINVTLIILTVRGA
jgi:thioredoxin-like negative regulator of GroEL